MTENDTTNDTTVRTNPPTAVGTAASVVTNDPNNIAPVTDTQSSTTTTAVVISTTETKLYQSTRLTGYITLAVASFINYDAARKSDSLGGRTHVPATSNQKAYAVAVALVNFSIVIGIILIHIDRFTPLEKVWLAAFKTGSNIELLINIFLVIWWTIAVILETSVDGIAGDGKGQYSLYYSLWACCLTSYWVLERWWVAAGWSSLKSFISSWPHRSPAWIVIAFLSFTTLMWYVDLRSSISNLERPEEKFLKEYFGNIGEGQWQLLLIVTSFTFIPSIVFVLIELFRDSNPDGTVQSKSKIEIIIEGVCFLFITLLWVPTVMIATTPGGAASLIGNTYFFTWLLVVFVFEGVVWFIHDVRKEQHKALRKKEQEYRRKQQRVLEETKAIQRLHRQNNNNIIQQHTNVNSSINDWDDSAMMTDTIEPPPPDHR